MRISTSLNNKIRLNSEKFQNFHLQAEIVIFVWFLRIHLLLWFSIKNDNSSMEMKILKFLGIQPTIKLYIKIV